MAEPTARLTLKVGDKEVRYEAGVERVEAQLRRLATEMLRSGEGHRELTLTAPAASRGEAAPADGAPRKAPPLKELPPVSDATAALLAAARLERAEAARLYFVDGSGTLALRTLPATGRDTRADALMLVLYGMLTLRGRSPLTARALLAGVRASGLRLTRASRNLEGKSRWVAAGGLRGGMRYRLTAEGVAHCEELISRLLPLL